MLNHTKPFFSPFFREETSFDSHQCVRDRGKQHQMQFLQQVMGHEMQRGSQSQPNPFPQVPLAYQQVQQVQQPVQPMMNQNVAAANPEHPPNFQPFYDQFNQQQMMFHWQQQQPMQQPQQWGPRTSLEQF